MRSNRMAMVPNCWTHRFKVLKLVEHTSGLQPKTPSYTEADEEWRGMLENQPQSQIVTKLGAMIAFSDKLYTQMHDATVSCEVNDRVLITHGFRPDGEDISGETFLVLEKGSDAACFDTFFLERLL